MPMTNEGSLNGSGHIPKGAEMDLVATHQRLLIAAAMRTTGPILELGVGWYSTPLLHEIARAQQRFLKTVDNNPDWLNQFRNLECEWHNLALVGWWGDLHRSLTEEEIGLVFVDNGQPAEREWVTRFLLKNQGRQAVYVFHDTEEGPAYGYNRLLPMFPHQWTDKCQKAHTTIASLTVPVEEWRFYPLPPVEPTQEVT